MPFARSVLMDQCRMWRCGLGAIVSVWGIFVGFNRADAQQSGEGKPIVEVCVGPAEAIGFGFAKNRYGFETKIERIGPDRSTGYINLIVYIPEDRTAYIYGIRSNIAESLDSFTCQPWR